MQGTGEGDLGWFCGVWLLSGEGEGDVGMACTHDEGGKMAASNGYGRRRKQPNASHSISRRVCGCGVGDATQLQCSGVTQQLPIARVLCLDC
jgi:hypothetical protein